MDPKLVAFLESHPDFEVVPADEIQEYNREMNAKEEQFRNALIERLNILDSLNGVLDEDFLESDDEELEEFIKSQQCI